MFNLASSLWRDENGFLVSAELILVSTVLVLGMVVGLAEVSHAVNQELEDVASAFGAINQSYRYEGLYSQQKSYIGGSGFGDQADVCDSQWDIVGAGAQSEADY